LKTKKNLKDHWRDLCADLSEDDGYTADELKRQDRSHSDSRASTRSTQRLCAHAMRSIHLSLLADCRDSDLQSLEVTSVEPYPDAKRLLVTLKSKSPAKEIERINSKVHAVSHLLRHAVARSLSRKRTPQLVIVVLSDEEACDAP
jgi:ribosome-binding factor A